MDVEIFSHFAKHTPISKSPFHQWKGWVKSKRRERKREGEKKRDIVHSIFAYFTFAYLLYATLLFPSIGLSSDSHCPLFLIFSANWLTLLTVTLKICKCQSIWSISIPSLFYFSLLHFCHKTLCSFYDERTERLIEPKLIKVKQMWHWWD